MGTPRNCRGVLKSNLFSPRGVAKFSAGCKIERKFSGIPSIQRIAGYNNFFRLMILECSCLLVNNKIWLFLKILTVQLTQLCEICLIILKNKIQGFGKTLTNKQRFYFHTEIGVDFAHQIYASMGTIEFIRKNIKVGSRKYLVDGTFRVVPRLFKQLLVISIEYMNNVNSFNRFFMGIITGE